MRESAVKYVICLAVVVASICILFSEVAGFESKNGEPALEALAVSLWVTDVITIVGNTVLIFKYRPERGRGSLSWGLVGLVAGTGTMIIHSREVEWLDPYFQALGGVAAGLGLFSALLSTGVLGSAVNHSVRITPTLIRDDNRQNQPGLMLRMTF